MGIPVKDLDKAEAWSGSGAILSANPDGTPRKHIVTINEATDDTLSSGNFPELVLSMGNEEGAIKDWIVVLPDRDGRPGTYGKVVQMLQAAGVPVPEGDAELSAAPLVGKRVQITVAKKPKINNPGETRDEVVAYESIASDVPAGGSQATAGAAGGAGDKPLPF